MDATEKLHVLLVEDDAAAAALIMETLSGVGYQVSCAQDGVTGFDMAQAGSYDILIVDRSLEASHGKIVIAAVDGQLTVKRLIKKNQKTWLYPENKNFKPILLKEEQDIIIWGVVSNVIHKV